MLSRYRSPTNAGRSLPGPRQTFGQTALFISSSSANSQLQSKWESFYNKAVKHTGLNGFLSIELDKVSVEGSKVLAATKLTVAANHMAITGKTHGGTIAALADTAIGFGAFVAKPDSNGFSVIDTTINFLNSASIGDVITAEAALTHSGRSTQVWDASVFRLRDGERTKIAVVRATALNHSEYKSIADSPMSEKEIEAKKQKLGHGFNVSTMSKADIAQRFDKHAQNWELLVKASKYEQVFKWLSAHSSRFAHQPQLKILDLACGVGLIGKELRRAGVSGRLTGVDISSKMLQHALVTGHYNGGVYLRDLDAELDLEAASPTKTFDVIVCTGATELLADPGTFLKRVAHLMDKTSQLFISFQHDDGKANPIEYQGVKRFSEDQVKALLTSAGLRTLHVTPTPEAYLMPSKDGSSILPVPFLLVLACRQQG